MPAFDLCSVSSGKRGRGVQTFLRFEKNSQKNGGGWWLRGMMWNFLEGDWSEPR